MCYHCGSAVEAGRLIGFGETCPDCKKDMHVCRMCVFFSPKAHWECLETIEAAVLDKDRRNFCDWFRLNPRFHNQISPDAVSIKKEKDAKSAFDALFKI